MKTLDYFSIYHSDFKKMEKSSDKQELISNKQLNRLLDIVGPEGLYEIANKLKETADNDMYNALNNKNYDY